MDNRRAIYIPFAQAVPKVATIDPNYCNMLKNGKCGVCAKVCSAGAIDYKQTDTFIEQEYGAIVAATASTPSIFPNSTNLPTARVRTWCPASSLSA